MLNYTKQSKKLPSMQIRLFDEYCKRKGKVIDLAKIEKEAEKNL